MFTCESEFFVKKLQEEGFYSKEQLLFQLIIAVDHLLRVQKMSFLLEKVDRIDDFAEFSLKTCFKLRSLEKIKVGFLGFILKNLKLIIVGLKSLNLRLKRIKFLLFIDQSVA